MNYSEALEYLYSCLPMFHRQGKAAYKADLKNTVALMDLLNHPYKNFKSIHVAGTNGKGSVSHMIASVLMEKGYKTGLYTSPHLLDFRERIKINGQMIPKEFVVSFINKYKSAFDEIKPSFFEWTVALCFHYFALENIDYAVIETGLGGRLDSTNVITPELSVITNISFDHTDLLGDSLSKIAFEKAGIIKTNVPIVVGEFEDETASVFQKVAKEKNAALTFASNTYKVSKFGKEFHLIENGITKIINCPLQGNYQAKNIATVVSSLKSNVLYIDENLIFKGIKNVLTNTGFIGRWQIMNESPKIIADTAHNEAGIKEIMQQLKAETGEKLRIVAGFMKDKDLNKILPHFPNKALYYLCKPQMERAMDLEQLEVYFLERKLEYQKYESVIKAVNSALNESSKNDLIFIGGSTFVVAEYLRGKSENNEMVI